MKRDSKPAAEKPPKPELAKATCPARPSDYCLLKQAAAVQNIRLSEAFGRATRRYVLDTCPQVMGKQVMAGVPTE